MAIRRVEPLPATLGAVLSAPFTEQELRALLVGSSDLVLVLDRRGYHRKIACSDSSQLAEPPQTMLGKRLDEVLPGALADLGQRTLEAVFRDGRPRRIGYSLSLAGGEHYFEALVQPVDYAHVLWIARDVTEQQATTTALARRFEATALLNRISMQLMDLPPDHLDAGIALALSEISRHSGIDCAYLYRLAADDDLVRSHGWPPAADGQGRTIRHDVAAADLPWTLSQLRNRQLVCFGSPAELPMAAATDLATFATLGIHSVILAPIFYAGSLRGLVGFESLQQTRRWNQEQRDLALAAAELLGSALQRRDSEAAMFRLAYYDSLTGLPNRQHQREELHRRLTADNTPFGVVLLDLDDSRLLNDIFGRELGDLLLRQIAARLQAMLAAGNVLCRWGSDEFMLTVPAADAEAALAAAQRIQEAIAAPIAIGGQEIQVSCSVGTAHNPTDGSDAEALVHAAETALWHARQQGRGSRQRFLPQQREEATRRSAILSALRRALDTDGLSLAFQPQYCLHRNIMVGVEALLRLDAPELGPVAPDEFVPIAEENGLISSIGDWVIRQACREIAGWRPRDGHSAKLAINVSPQQLLDVRLLRSLRGAIREHGLSPTQIELEITENMLMEPDHLGVRWLRRFRRNGFGIAVDDFGTGYSSLGKLKHLPTTALKIDRSFVRDLLADDDDRAIVRAIIAMAHQLQLQVVAEGVETPDQLAFLRDSGCDLVQGLVFAGPLTADEAAQRWAAGDCGARPAPYSPAVPPPW